MKSILFKKAVSVSYSEVKQVCESIDKMLDHVPLVVDGKRYWDHGCRASINKNHSGSWDVVVMSDRIPASKHKRKVHISMEKASPDFHLPYMRLQINVESSKNNTNVLRLK